MKRGKFATIPSFIFIYRDEYYKGVTEECSIAEIIIAKNRYDALSTVPLEWRGQYGKFSERL